MLIGQNAVWDHSGTERFWYETRVAELQIRLHAGQKLIGPVLFSVLGTAAFLAFCFTIGRRWVARIIRWTNDHFVIEMPVITMIRVIMIALAVVTKFIGVHTVLGAFVAGIMIGQSPILTKHIEEQLRGLIVFSAICICSDSRLSSSALRVLANWAAAIWAAGSLG